MESHCDFQVYLDSTFKTILTKEEIARVNWIDISNITDYQVEKLLQLIFGEFKKEEQGMVQFWRFNPGIRKVRGRFLQVSHLLCVCALPQIKISLDNQDKSTQQM